MKQSAGHAEEQQGAPAASLPRDHDACFYRKDYQKMLIQAGLRGARGSTFARGVGEIIISRSSSRRASGRSVERSPRTTKAVVRPGRGSREIHSPWPTWPARSRFQSSVEYIDLQRFAGAHLRTACGSRADSDYPIEGRHVVAGRGHNHTRPHRSTMFGL